MTNYYFKRDNDEAKDDLVPSIKYRIRNSLKQKEKIVHIKDVEDYSSHLSCEVFKRIKNKMQRSLAN